MVRVTRLFCLPHAGAGVAGWRSLAKHLPQLDWVPLDLPGRDGRRSEPAHLTIAAAVHELAPRIETDRPYAVLGHSMGALLAFELVRALRRMDAPAPEHLLLSSRRAPHLPDPFPAMHSLPEAAFIAELQRRFSALPQVLLDSPALLALFLPTLRADYAKLDTYVHVEELPLSVPITVMWGRADTRLEHSDLEAWQQHTTGGFRLLPVEGGHFWFKDDPAPLLAELAAVLR
jgi:surfactin synthase thioesterase subunit